jgi:two-component system cell cycle response regulator
VDFIKGAQSGSSRSKEPRRVLLVEEDGETLSLARQALKAFRGAEFVIETVTSSREVRDALAARAFEDELTGLYSKPFFVEALRNETRRLLRYERDLSCMMLALDGFALVREAQGQEAADTALKQVAAFVLNSIREGDIVARWGPDELGVLLVETPASLGRRVAERVRFGIAGSAVIVEDQPRSITVSVGICSINRQHHLQPDAILDRAVAALRQAMVTGGNRVCLDANAIESDQEGPIDLGQQSDVESA